MSRYEENADDELSAVGRRETPMKTPGGTLEEELEQAADIAAVVASMPVNDAAGLAYIGLAARLRQRAARVKEERERLAADLLSWQQAGDARVESIVAARLATLDKVCGPSLTPGTEKGGG